MLLLILIGVPVLEVFVFIEVGVRIGWLPAILLLLASSFIGARVMRAQGRAAIEQLSSASLHDRPDAREAIYRALGFLGGLLLLIPGFVTDVFGVLLVLPPTRRLARRWTSHHYAGRLVSFVGATRRFGPRGRGAYPTRPADVESTAVDDDLDALER